MFFKTKNNIFSRNKDVMLGLTLKDSGGASTPALVKSLVNPKLWEDAKMDEVVNYLAQSKFVQLPEVFADAFS